MRIGDWSADVCASDLLDARHHFSFADYRDPARVNWGRLRVWNDDRIAAGSGFPDRKSVVSGQSVSVRVDLGGRRILKKKNQHKAKQVVYSMNETNIVHDTERTIEKSNTRIRIL